MINKEVIIFQIEDMLSNINKENLLLYGGHIDNGATFLELMTNILTLLKKQDTKTGYWITEEPNTYTRRTYCSVCSKSAPFIYVSDDYYGGRSHGETKKTKYCPNCGAKMET